MKDSKLKQLYFSHDIFADKDEKIIKMLYYFRKNIDNFRDDFIKKNFFHASFGLFWEIVQYMHRNELTVNEIPVLADELRTDEEFVRLIIENFNLFRIEENGQIISDRILRNLDEVSKKSSKNKIAAQARWLLSAFNKAYEEFFNEKPILQSEEIEALKKYNAQIPNLREKLRDILFTLKGLKFKDIPNFKPGANWLLKGNNLAKLVNGEFGELQHKPTEEEIKEQKHKRAEEEKKINAPSELDLKISSCSSKENALQIIEDYYHNKKLPIIGKKARVFPDLRNKLMEKFNITDEEVLKRCGP